MTDEDLRRYIIGDLTQAGIAAFAALTLENETIGRYLLGELGEAECRLLERRAEANLPLAEWIEVGESELL